MAFIPNFIEKISQIIMNSHELPFIRTSFVYAFGVFLQNPKTSRMEKKLQMEKKIHEIPRILNILNYWQFLGVGS